VLQIEVPKSRGRDGANYVIPPHLSEANGLNRPNNRHPEKKVGDVRSQVDHEKSPRKPDGVRLHQPEIQPGDETESSQGQKENGIDAQQEYVLDYEHRSGSERCARRPDKCSSRDA